MSSAQSNRGLGDDADAGSRDTRNLLVEVVAAVARELAPRAIVVENVLAFLTRKVRHPDTGVPIAAARLLIDRLEDDYQPFAMRADLADFGVPQARKRAFLVLLRRTERAVLRMMDRDRAPFPSVTHGRDGRRPHITIDTALRSLDAGPLDSARPETAGEGMHRVPVWDDHRYAMAATIAPGSGRSAWENTSCPRCGTVDVDPEAAACPLCDGPLARPVVYVDGRWRLIKGFRNSSYRRMAPNRPAAAITTASGRMGSDNTLHPYENRVLSMLECQYLQTIPRDFRWGGHLEAFGHTSLRQMIGEAVPPQFTELHGRVLAALLDGRIPRHAMPARDSRVLAAGRRLRLASVGDQA